ncbi:MAG: hypothetical protein A2Y12_02505 [Planctomycetes bacterium GWF2_42_9]|nr:MAG: hypothetical protein A2Y12_02505 [Planctomycetes bacterium GWF2_42_9]
MLKNVVWYILIVAVVPGLVIAKVSMKTDFQSSNFPIGQISAAGDGSVTDVNGLWTRYPTSGAGDPWITSDPIDSNNKCLRISYGSGQRDAVGRSNIAPIHTGEPFIASWSMYLVGQSGQLGSEAIYADSMSKLSTLTSLDLNYCGIGFYNTTVGSLMWQNGPRSSAAGIPMAIAGTQLIDDCNNKWIDIKVYVKTWNDGSGIGYYDTWIRKHGTNNGSDGKWYRGDIDFPLASENQGDDVNGFLIIPRSPSGGDGVMCYNDKMRIATEAIDCQDRIILGQNYSGDLNSDCKVDINDMCLLAASWLGRSDTLTTPAWDIAHWDINDVTDKAPKSRPMLKWDGMSPQLTYSGGILEVYSPHSNDNPSSSAYLRIQDPYYVAGPPEKYDPNYFNVKIPTLVQVRWKLSSDDPTYAAILQVRERLYGTILMYFWPHLFKPGTGYADPCGFITMSFVLSPLNGHLNNATMYFKNNSTGKWDEITTVYTSTGFYTPSTFPCDAFYLGDIGSGAYGDYYFDYMYVSQNSVTVQNFMNLTAIQKRDLGNDGIVGFSVFAIMASQWCQTANLLP